MRLFLCLLSLAPHTLCREALSNASAQEAADACDRARQPKSAFSSTLRYLVTVGIEHSGHHMWSRAFWYLVHAGALPGGHGAAGSKLAMRLRKATVTRGGGACVPRWEQRAEEVRDAFVTLPLHFKHRARGVDTRLVALEPYCSYPCYKSVEYPDVVTLSRGADAARADLRLMVLTRPAHKMIYTPTLKRLDDLIDGCTRLVFQLSLLDPRFFFCFPYEPPELEAELEVASSFLGCSHDALALAVKAAYHVSNRSGAAWSALDGATPAMEVRARFTVFRQCTRTLEQRLCADARALHLGSLRRNLTHRDFSRAGGGEQGTRL